MQGYPSLPPSTAPICTDPTGVLGMLMDLTRDPEGLQGSQKAAGTLMGLLGPRWGSWDPGGIMETLMWLW